MAINFLNTVAVDDSVLFVDIVNDRVGVGTDNPSEKLEVSGSNTLSIKLSRNNTDATYVTTLTNNYSASLGTELKSGTYNILTHGNSTGTALNFTNGAMTFDYRNSEYMRITSDGRVGIGTTTPGFKLDVTGEGNFTSYLNVNSSTGIRSTGWVHLQRYATNLNVSVGNNGTNVHFLVPNGDIQIKTSLLSNQENTDIDTGAEVVAQVAHATYTAAFFDFVVNKGTNVRSGTVYACHNGDTTPLVEFTETSTNDLGDTSDVTLSVDISGANMRLLATVTSDDWIVKSLIRAI